MTGRGEHGSVTVEVVLLTPVLLAAACFIVFLGRLAQARAEVDELAHLAVATAATTRPVDTATRNAETETQTVANQHGRLCATPIVTVDDTHLQPGGYVTAAVTCTLNLADLAPLSVPGTHTVTAVEVAPVDRYRTGTPAP